MSSPPNVISPRPGAGHARVRPRAGRARGVDLFTRKVVRPARQRRRSSANWPSGRPPTLGFHVTYWDDLGWKDTASFAGATERQAAYAGHPAREFHTAARDRGPQERGGMSRRAEVASAIAAARAEMETGTEIAVARRNGRIAVTVGSARAAPGSSSSASTGLCAPRWHGARTADAPSHRPMSVRSLRILGTCRASPCSFSEAVPAGQDVAVIVQQSDGRILGAARLAPGAKRWPSGQGADARRSRIRD